MDSSAELEILARSVSNYHSLAYTTYVGDGDSSFKRLVEINPDNIMEIVRKEECLGQTQKRLKTNILRKQLREL